MARRPSYARGAKRFLSELRDGVRVKKDASGKVVARHVFPDVLNTDDTATLLGISTRQAVRVLSRLQPKRRGGGSTGRSVGSLVVTREAMMRYLIQVYREAGGDDELGVFEGWLARRREKERVAVPNDQRSYLRGKFVPEKGSACFKAQSWEELMTGIATLAALAQKDPRVQDDVDATLSGRET